MPGPLQVTVDPSPVVQVTYDGVAVAAAVTHPPALHACAEVVTECQIDGATPNHSARFTYPVVDGLSVGDGAGSWSSLAALAPAVAGSGGAAPGTCPSPNHCTPVPMPWVLPWTQRSTYQAPGWTAPAGGGPPLAPGNSTEYGT